MRFLWQSVTRYAPHPYLGRSGQDHDASVGNWATEDDGDWLTEDGGLWLLE